MSSKSYNLNTDDVSSLRLSAFAVVKYTSLTFAAVLFVGAIASIPAGPDIIDSLMINGEEIDEEVDEESIAQIKSIWYYCAVLTMLIAAVGIVGILRENLWLSSIYAFYLLLVMFGSILATSIWRSNPFSLVVLSIFTAWTVMFAFLLLRKRSQSNFDTPPLTIA